MNKYLLTWYGITDFKASLGLEHTSGPVLAALLAEDYTDVFILGFTNSKKSNISGLSEEDIFQKKLFEIEISNPATAEKVLEQFSNTEEAHKHFIQWLREQLLDAENKVVVHFQPVNLQYLNDTEGIYEAATESLNAVSAQEGEKLVTLYLSPGTPVMAFVWAFAALRYPNLKKRLIPLLKLEDRQKQSPCRTSGWNGMGDRYEQRKLTLNGMTSSSIFLANSECPTYSV
jgi:hypothetical protein